MWHARTVSPKSGGRKVKAGRRGDNWQHLCTVGPKLADPVETLGIDPDRPLPCWGWGDIPDQYGRRWNGDDGSTPMPPAPDGMGGLPPFLP